MSIQPTKDSSKKQDDYQTVGGSVNWNLTLNDKTKFLDHLKEKIAFIDYPLNLFTPLLLKFSDQIFVFFTDSSNLSNNLYLAIKAQSAVLKIYTLSMGILNWGPNSRFVVNSKALEEYVNKKQLEELQKRADPLDGVATYCVHWHECVPVQDLETLLKAKSFFPCKKETITLPPLVTEVLTSSEKLDPVQKGDSNPLNDNRSLTSKSTKSTETESDTSSKSAPEPEPKRPSKRLSAFFKTGLNRLKEIIPNRSSGAFLPNFNRENTAYAIETGLGYIAQLSKETESLILGAQPNGVYVINKTTSEYTYRILIKQDNIHAQFSITDQGQIKSAEKTYETFEKFLESFQALGLTLTPYSTK